MIRTILSLGLVLALGEVATAKAATPADPCRGASPSVGEHLRGPVLHVLDGHTLCVALAADPGAWVKLELADAPREAGWGELMSVAFGKDVDCVATGERRAVCRRDGVSVAGRLGTAASQAAAAAWRSPAQSETLASFRVAVADRGGPN